MMVWYELVDEVLAVGELPTMVLANGLLTPAETFISRQDWAGLADAGWYREYKEPSYLYMDGYAQAVVGAHPNDQSPVAYLAAGPILPADTIRQDKFTSIEGQVSNPTSQDVVRDPALEADLVRELSAASEKIRELQDAPDEGLENFDTTLDIKSSQDDSVEYSQFDVSIVYLDEWAGAPGNNLGFVSELHLLTDSDSTVGEEARLIVKEAPSDVGAVLPFVQDPEDPFRWTCEARDGHKWSDPEESAAVQLLWGTGSLPASPVLRCEGLYARQSTPVRYGVTGLRGERSSGAAVLRGDRRDRIRSVLLGAGKG